MGWHYHDSSRIVMAQKVSIKKNFLYSSILTTANYIFPLLTYPYVSRVLGVTNIGICNFVDSVVNYFILISMMGVGIYGIREVAACKGDRGRLDRAFSDIFMLNTIATTIALALLLITTFAVPQLAAHKHLMLIGAMKLVFNYLLVEWLYKGLEEFRYITMRTLMVKTGYVISVFVFVRGPEDYPIYYLLIVMMIVINAVINSMYARHHVTLRLRGLDMRRFVKPFFIFGAYSLITSMYTSFNVAWLGFVAGETQVGYYTTATKLYAILLSLYTAFTGVMMPRMSALLAEGRIDEAHVLLEKSMKILFGFALPLVILTTIAAPQIIMIISGPGYEGAIMPMRIVMPLMLIIGYEQILIVQTLMPMKKDKAVLTNSIIGAVIGVTLNILLVPVLKSTGSAIVWLASETAVLVSAQFFVSKYTKMHFPWRCLSRYFTIYAPLAIIIMVFYNKLDNMIVFVILFVISILYVLAVNASLISSMIRKR